MQHRFWLGGSALALALVLSVLVVVPILPSSLAATVPAAQAGLSLASNGSLSASVTTTVQNGSALRYAIDGNFTPLLAGLPLNNSTRASILAQIAQLESSPIFGGLFGNRDGTVSALEVTLFVALIENEARLLPSGTVLGTGTLGLTLDGLQASSVHLDSLTLSGAVGPDNSSAPIGVAISSTFTFLLSGTQHTLLVSLTGLGSLPGTGPVGPSFGVSFTTPAGMTVTSTSGLSAVTRSNDVWGWGSASVSGTFTPLTSPNASIDFTSAFPTGYVVIGLAIGAAAAGVGVYWYRRRRARNRSATGEGGSGPSGSG